MANSSSSSSSSSIKSVKKEGIFSALMDSFSSSSSGERRANKAYQDKCDQARHRQEMLREHHERQRQIERQEAEIGRQGFYNRCSSEGTPDRSDAERHRNELQTQHRDRIEKNKRIQERKEAEKRRESLQNNSDRSRSNFSSSSSSYSNPRPGPSGYQRPPTLYGNNIRPTFRGEPYQNVLGYNTPSSSSSSSGSSSGNVGGNAYGRGIGDPSWQRGKY